MKREKHVFSRADQVCHAWAAGSATWGRSSNVFYNDLDTIYSYGHHFPLACAISRVPGKEIALLNSSSYSNTTSKHQGDILGAISHWPVKIHCPDPRGGLRGDHRENLDYFHDQAKAAWDSIKGARTRGPEYVREYSSFKQVCSAYCSVFSVKNPFKWLSNATIQAVLDREEERARPAREAQERAREARQQRERERWAARDAEQALALEEKIRLWRVHELKWGLPWGAGTLLRLSRDGKRIQTSHGAEVLRVHAPVLWATVQRVRAGGTDWVPENTITVDHFRLSKVGADGTLFIGCHTIPYAEIERMAGELGLTTGR